MKLYSFLYLCCLGRSTSAAENGNWRSGDRPKAESPPPQRRSNNRYGNTRNTREDAAPSEERPRLKLQPRTVPFGMFMKFSFLFHFLLKLKCFFCRIQSTN